MSASVAAPTAGTQKKADALDRANAGWRLDAVWLAPLLVLFVAKQVLLVAIVAPFLGHDEVDHFYYVARLAQGDGLGVVGEVELPEAAAPYEEYVADYPYNAEVIQPPLYHGLLAPLYLLAPGGDEAHLYLLRFVSVGLGVVVVWLAYLTARLLFPGELVMRAGVPIFVAFQPQFSFVAAIVNHDILVIVLVSLVVYLLLRGVGSGFSPRHTLAIGMLSAAGVWTKVSFGLVLPVVAVGMLFAARDARLPRRFLIRDLVTTVGLPLLIAVPWFVRSFSLYGDPTGASRLHDIYGDRREGSYWDMLSSPSFWRGRLEDFWGNYGWRQIPFEPVDYGVIAVVWGLAALALAALVARALVERWLGLLPALTRFQWRGLGLLALSIVSFGYGVLYVGTIQFTQSRFIFPAMIGFGVLSLVGINFWLPVRWRPAAVPILAVVLMAFNVYVALRYVIPFFYGPGGGVVPRS